MKKISLRSEGSRETGRRCDKDTSRGIDHGLGKFSNGSKILFALFVVSLPCSHPDFRFPLVLNGIMLKGSDGCITMTAIKVIGDLFFLQERLFFFVTSDLPEQENLYVSS